MEKNSRSVAFSSKSIDAQIAEQVRPAKLSRDFLTQNQRLNQAVKTGASLIELTTFLQSYRNLQHLQP